MGARWYAIRMQQGSAGGCFIRRGGVQVCQLVKDVGRGDLVGVVLEEVRACFGRLHPQHAACLLAWLPADLALPLLQAQVRPQPAGPRRTVRSSRRSLGPD